MIHSLHRLNGHAIVVHHLVGVVGRSVSQLTLFGANAAEIKCMRLRMAPIQRTVVTCVIRHLGRVHVVVVQQNPLAREHQQRFQRGLLIRLG